MSRSVVLKGGPRCERCCQPNRWCICDAEPKVKTPLAIDVLQHSNEVHKPTSTGSLILREVEGARGHVYQRGQAFDARTLALPGRELWFLHPNGETVEALPEPSHLQVVLLDASWSESRLLERACDGVGRRVSLPMQGQSRYWLRAQNGDGRFSTIEALVFLLQLLGRQAEADRLASRLERHVYAGLRSRGKVMDAESYLASSRFAPVLLPLSQ